MCQSSPVPRAAFLFGQAAVVLLQQIAVARHELVAVVVIDFLSQRLGQVAPDVLDDVGHLVRLTGGVAAAEPRVSAVGLLVLVLLVLFLLALGHLAFLLPAGELLRAALHPLLPPGHLPLLLAALLLAHLALRLLLLLLLLRRR